MTKMIKHITPEFINLHDVSYEILVESEYVSNSSLALWLEIEGDPSYNVVVSVNLVNETLGEREFFLDANNPAAVAAGEVLLEHGMISHTGETAQSGWVTYPKMVFNPKAATASIDYSEKNSTRS